MTVTAGSSAISTWTVSWTLASGEKITNSWNATLTTSGSTATFANAGYNGALAPGATTTFGFLADGGSSAPSLTCTAS
ncbi:cellulose binding domain-containing protein [Actinoplanes sp. NPDC051343]|uniref:cellulose binding domain-containing protein n=1 Tax=Actinoplanes sp. NPDC051343 TaxID=3363906 RepID=UPI0037A64841